MLSCMAEHYLQGGTGLAADQPRTQSVGRTKCVGIPLSRSDKYSEAGKVVFKGKIQREARGTAMKCAK